MLLIVISAVTFVRIGQYAAPEGIRSNGLLWPSLSLAMYWLVVSVLQSGMALRVLGQGTICVGIGIFPAAREP